ncbi:MAG: SUMF1/EgtB/PvdO family nonheme iron enzyme [Candidatus Thiodiazotropha sp.]
MDAGERIELPTRKFLHSLSGLSVYLNSLLKTSKGREWQEIIQSYLSNLGISVRRPDSFDSESEDLYHHLIGGVDIIVWLVFPETDESSFFSKELEIARMQGKPIIPIVIDDAPIPDPLQDIQAIHHRDDEKETLQQLAQVLTTAWEKIKTTNSAQSPRKLLLPDIDWVEIPGGNFIFSEGEERQTIYLERFRISRYPITNVQYQCFIDAGGYQEERWWQDLKQPAPEKPRWGQSNRPRTDVNWYEAVAFSRWLAEQLKQTIRLPTEQEWEMAARGTDSRVYPWGDEHVNGYANTKESGLEETSAVGIFIQDKSPYGVMDLEGNVWEWCLNKYGHPEQIAPDTSGDLRTQRGGCWLDLSDDARTGDRGWYDPVIRYYFRGFRVVWSTPMK